jgi:hypothetical protein
MTYYTLPKSHNIIEINPTVSNVKIVTQTSHSLSKYYNDLRLQLLKYKIEDIDQIICKSMTPNDIFFSRTKFSGDALKKLNPSSSLFYEILEVIISLNLSFDGETVNCIHIGQNCLDSKRCIELVREREETQNKDENHKCFEFICEDMFNIINEKRYNFIFYETSSISGNNYVLELLQCLMVLLKYQAAGGGCIIKLEQMFHKPVIDILYILSCIYDKVSIIKPTTSNITSFERFIVCKNFLLNDKRKEAYKAYYFKIGNFISSYKENENDNISSIVNFDVPYLFLNKIDDINIIFGQQQLDNLNQVISVLKSKNPDEKMVSMKKKSLLTTNNWSEKIKTLSSTNIFLKQKTDDKEKEKEKDRGEKDKEKEKNCFL